MVTIVKQIDDDDDGHDNDDDDDDDDDDDGGKTNATRIKPSTGISSPTSCQRSQRQVPSTSASAGCIDVRSVVAETSGDPDFECPECWNI